MQDLVDIFLLFLFLVLEKFSSYKCIALECYTVVNLHSENAELCAISDVVKSRGQTQSQYFARISWVNDTYKRIKLKALCRTHNLPFLTIIPQSSCTVIGRSLLVKLIDNRLGDFIG